MNVPCKLCYVFQEYVRRFPSLGRNVQSIAQNNCLASVNAKKKSKRLQRTQNGYVSCKSNLRGAIHESLSQPQLSLPGVRQKVSLTQHVCPANCMLAAPNYCRNYMPENIKTLTWKTCRSLHAQSLCCPGGESANHCLKPCSFLGINTAAWLPSNLCRMVLPWMFPANTAISIRNLSEGFPHSAHVLGYLC